MGNGVFTPSWAPANPTGGSQRGTCFCVVHTASMTSQIDIDCKHYYGDGELGTARPVDINDHQESTERHGQRAVRQTTETPQRLKRVLVS